MNFSAQTILGRTICALLTAAACPLAIAGTMEDAMKFYDEGQFRDAARVLRAIPQPSGRASGVLCDLYVKRLIVDEGEKAKQVCSAAAAARDPHGLVMYAFAHTLNNPPAGIPHDEQRSVSYLAEATELGFPPAFDRFCDYFYSKKMYAEATPFCKFAAAHNLPNSLYHMALMLFEGTGGIQDFEKASKFALASAHMNHALAFNLLGDLSRDGTRGVKKDVIHAYAWYALATSAAPNWAEPSASRNGLQLTNDQITEAQRLAGKWPLQAKPKSHEFYGAK